MKIVISGPATAIDSATDKAITQSATLKQLDGIVHDKESCCEYLDDELDEIELTGGHLRLVYNAEAKQLRIVTEYQSPRKLKPKELKSLVKQTTAQWSDGIGESYFWEEVHPGVKLDLSPQGQTKDLQTEQIDDGVKVPRKTYSPLLKAAEAGDIDKIKKLIAKGEDINSRNKRNRPVLHVAIWNKHIEAALFLVEQGADINIRDTGKDADNHTPLHVACWILSTAGPAVPPMPLVQALVQKGADVDAKNSDGKTPLMWAAHGGDVGLVTYLIERGADVNVRDTKKSNEGKTPLMSTYYTEVIQLLLERGADPNIRTDRGWTSYEHAIFQAGNLVWTDLGWITLESAILLNVLKRNYTLVKDYKYDNWMGAAVPLLAAVRSRAEQGDGASQYTIAEYHDRGFTMPKNAEEAFRVFERSATNGYRLALVRLGICHRDGKGTAVEPAKAMDYFRQAADAGVPLAMGILGECHAEGRGVAKDQTAAIKWYRRGIDVDVGKAKPNEISTFRTGMGACHAELGACYDEGKGVPQDLHEALKEFDAAWELNFHAVKPVRERLQQLLKKK